MSASLVGSEMCIRDSSLGRRRDVDILRGWAFSPRPGVSQGGRSAGASYPVSYTHLTLPTICSV
eukprot:12050991-Alexandrium_andersonii.AAC.1